MDLGLKVFMIRVAFVNRVKGLLTRLVPGNSAAGAGRMEDRTLEPKPRSIGPTCANKMMHHCP